MFDQLKQLGTAARPSVRAAQPYRRNIVGLPLQRSLFDLTRQAATATGLPALTFPDDFPAWLDEKGDLFLDRAKVAAIVEALPPWFTPVTLKRMKAGHAAACADLVATAEDAARLGPLPEGVVHKRCLLLAKRMSLVMAYGILSKFVPDVLLRALAEEGDVGPPPFPQTSAGAKLMIDTLALSQAISAIGYSPARLQREWPHVPAAAYNHVRHFCKRQSGFGPLAWDSPGYEDAEYVVHLLQSIFHEVDPEHFRRSLSFADRPPASRSTAVASDKVTALRQALEFWLDFLERETWYVRRAFYLGMIPLLRQLVTEYRPARLQLVDLLFLEIDELVAGVTDPELIDSRRRRYLENIDYLNLHGADFVRFTSTLENL